LMFSIFLPTDTIPRVLILNSWLLYILSLVPTFLISYFVSRHLGNFIYKKLSIFNESLKRKFATYLLIGTIITILPF
jgi:hypothetical protein